MRLNAIIETEVDAPVDDHRHAGNNKASVKAMHSVRPICLNHAIYYPVELFCAVLLGIEDVVC